MRRQVLELVSPGRDNARKDRRRSRWGEPYQVHIPLFHEPNKAVPAATERWPCPVHEAQGVDPSSAKSVYLEAARTILKDWILATWGRVQQREELEYERIVEQALARVQLILNKDEGTVLEEFDGVLDKFVGDVAHVTLTTKSGETLLGEYPASELLRKGVRANRRFKCRTVAVGENVQFRIESVPDIELSAERERKIRDWIQQSLGDADAPHDDY